MARKKKAANSDTNEVMIAEVAETVPETESATPPAVEQSTVAQSQPQQPMTENPEVAPPEESGADLPRFRSWTINRAAGYERLSDSKRGLILVKFEDRPFPASQPQRASVRFFGKPWAGTQRLMRCNI